MKSLVNFEPVLKASQRFCSLSFRPNVQQRLFTIYPKKLEISDGM